MHRALPLLAALLLVAGCGSGRLPDPPEAERARTLAAQAEAVHAAADAYFRGEGFTAAPVDRTARDPGAAWERPAAGVGALFGPATERVVAVTAPAASGTRLVLLVRYRGADGSHVTVSPLLMRATYGRYLDGIAARVAAGG